MFILCDPPNNLKARVKMIRYSRRSALKQDVGQVPKEYVIADVRVGTMVQDISCLEERKFTGTVNECIKKNTRNDVRYRERDGTG
jgi:hypothetical protein